MRQIFLQCQLKSGSFSFDSCSCPNFVDNIIGKRDVFKRQPVTTDSKIMMVFQLLQ